MRFCAFVCYIHPLNSIHSSHAKLCCVRTRAHTHTHTHTLRSSPCGSPSKQVPTLDSGGITSSLPLLCCNPCWWCGSHGDWSCTLPLPPALAHRHEVLKVLSNPDSYCTLFGLQLQRALTPCMFKEVLMSLRWYYKFRLSVQTSKFIIHTCWTMSVCFTTIVGHEQNTTKKAIIVEY